MGPLPKAKQKAHFIELGKEELPTFIRRKIKYQSPDGDYVPAFLLIPKEVRGLAPAMLCLHQTVKVGKDEPAGVGGNVNLHYARELAERGYVCIVPDYPFLGENEFDPYQHGYVSCTMKGIVNHRCAVDLLQSLPEVDGKRIGAIGHSLGGHNSLFVAAFDPRIRAVVTSCGFTSFQKYYNGDLSGWAGRRYMPLITEKYGNRWDRMPFDFSDILIALAPRPLFINAPLHDANFEVSGVQDCVKAVRPVYEKTIRGDNRRNKLANTLTAVYPDAEHSFPKDVRELAYEFLARHLGGKGK